MVRRITLIGACFVAGCAAQSKPTPVVQTVWQNPDIQRVVVEKPPPSKTVAHAPMQQPKIVKPKAVPEKQKLIQAKVTPPPQPKPTPVSKVDKNRKPLPKVATPKLSSVAIAKILVRESRARYPGNCACPYDRDRAGRRCGGRSAYSRPGGYAPLCFERDISPADIKRYRQSL